MLLIGITGAIGHGKSTLAECLRSAIPGAVHDESAAVISAFANAAKTSLPDSSDLPGLNSWLKGLRPLITEQLHLESAPGVLQITQANIKTQPDDFAKLFEYIGALQTQPGLRTELITEVTKPSHRALLQWFGGFFIARLAKNIWYDALMRRAEVARANGCPLFICGGLRFPAEAKTVHDHGGVVLEIIRPSLSQRDIKDPTERERKNVTADSQVLNDSTIVDLQKIAEQILKDMQQHKLEQLYSSRPRQD